MTKIKVSILSIAILIIMTGAASAPVLADIARHFPEADLQLVRMVITLFLLLGFSVLSFFSNLWLLGGAVVFAGFAMGILIPLIMDSVTKEVQARDTIFALAVINFSLYLGQFISPLIPGFTENLFKVSSIRFPFYVSALMTLFSIIGMLLSKKPSFSPSAYLYEKHEPVDYENH